LSATTRPERTVLILTAGSRGDVQPFVALARALQRAGDRPVLAAPARFGSLAREAGVPSVGLRIDFEALSADPDSTSRNPRVAVRTLRDVVLPMMREMLDDLAGAAEAAGRVHAVVHHPKTLGGEHIAEALGVPAVAALTIPMLTPTRSFPIPGVGAPRPRRRSEPSELPPAAARHHALSRNAPPVAE
jgi:sterol 3beta-glucosyltransferase